MHIKRRQQDDSRVTKRSGALEDSKPRANCEDEAKTEERLQNNIQEYKTEPVAFLLMTHTRKFQGKREANFFPRTSLCLFLQSQICCNGLEEELDLLICT